MFYIFAMFSCIVPMVAGFRKDANPQPNALPWLWTTFFTTAAPCLMALVIEPSRNYFLSHWWQIWLPLAAPCLVLSSLYLEFSVVQNQEELVELRKLQYNSKSA